jgi:hypothetical protein
MKVALDCWCQYHFKDHHAGESRGLISSMLLMYKSGQNAGDYHNKIESNNHVHWLKHNSFQVCCSILFKLLTSILPQHPERQTDNT